MSPIFTFMDNFGTKRYTIVMSDLAAAIFYELEGIKHASTESCHQILVAFFACMYNFGSPSSKSYELHERSFYFYPNRNLSKACTCQNYFHNSLCCQIMLTQNSSDM